MRSGVIVIGNHVQALGIIRSLGKKGVPVYLINNKNLCISRFSRHLKRFIKVDTNNDMEFINFMIKLAIKEGLEDWVLMPTNDAMVYILSKYKEVLEEYYKVPTPSWDVIKYAYDKKLTYKLAKRCGVPMPRTIYPEKLDDVLYVSSDLEYPVIIKGRNGYNFYQKTKIKAIYINSKKNL